MKLFDRAPVMSGLVLLMCLLAMTDASAQNAAALSRREELVKVRELINDPDPLMRLANFEALVEEGDATKLQIAIQIALTGNDPMLRAVALRAYLSGNREFIATLSLDPAIQQKIDRAMVEGEQAVHNVTKEFRYLKELVHTTSMKGSFKVSEFNMKNGAGIVSANWGTTRHKGVPVQASGDRLVGTIGIMNTSNSCPFEIHPTKELVLVGSMSCSGTGFGVVKITAPMF